VAEELLIFNASPTIVLARAGLLGIVDTAQVCVPHAVADEVLAGPTDDAGSRAIAAGWGRRESVPVPDIIIEWGLGAGESAVLACAMRFAGSRAVLDDREARMCARSLGIPVVGTLGLLAAARRHGRIGNLQVALDAVRAAGLWIDERVVAEAVRLADGR